MPPRKPSKTKADLERDKLAAEIRQLGMQARKEAAEARAAEILLENFEREERRKAASDERNFTYRFVDSVRESSVQKCVITLEQWARRAPGQAFTIVMDSPGGSVFDGFHLIDSLTYLRKHGHHITIVVKGMAASMGGVILQAADRRVITENSFMHIHELAGMAYGKVSDVEDEMKLWKMLADKGDELLASRSTMTKKQIQNKMKRREWWMDSATAKALGFVDEIAGEEAAA